MKKLLVKVMLIVMMVVKAYHVDIIELPQEELFVVKGNVSEEELATLKATYEEIPEVVRVAFEEENGQIVVLGEEYDVVEESGTWVPTEYRDYMEEKNVGIIGFSDRNSDTIYIASSAAYDDTLIHEMGHFIGSNGSVLDKLSLVNMNHFTDEWEEIWVSEAQYISDYAAVGDTEGFAECFKFMVTDEERFELWYPQSYEYIQSCISEL